MLIGKVINISSKTRWTDGKEHIVLDVRISEPRAAAVKTVHVGELTLPNDKGLRLDDEVEITFMVME